MLGRSFFEKLYNIGSELGFNPRDMLLVMYMESGVQPNAKNPGGARGLIQFEPSTLRHMGVPRKDIINFTKKPAEEQLDYVRTYIERNQAGYNNGQPFGSATKYYHSNFYPATLYRWRGSNPLANRNVVVVSSRSSSAQERGAYAENKILDTDHDGVITVGDLTAKLLQRAQEPGFQQMLQQLNNVAGEGAVTEQTIKRPGYRGIPHEKIDPSLQADLPPKGYKKVTKPISPQVEYLANQYLDRPNGTLIPFKDEDKKLLARVETHKTTKGPHKTIVIYEPENQRTALETDTQSPNMVSLFINKLDKMLDSFMHAASTKISISKYSNIYPKNNFIIVINSNDDLSSNLEYARLLSIALKEELDTDSIIFTDNNKVELECEIFAPKVRSFAALNELCNALSSAFEYATRKIGGIKIFTTIIPESSSCYQKLDIKLAEMNYRKFQLKFLNNKGIT